MEYSEPINYDNLKIGDRVKCVDDGNCVYKFLPKYLQNGKTYTVRDKIEKWPSKYIHVKGLEKGFNIVWFRQKGN